MKTKYHVTNIKGEILSSHRHFQLALSSLGRKLKHQHCYLKKSVNRIYVPLTTEEQEITTWTIQDTLRK